MAAAAASSVQDDGADKETAGQEGAWKIVGPGGKALADGKTVDKEAVEGQLNRGGLNLSGLVGRLREGEEPITSTPRKTVGEVRVGDWMCKDSVCGWNNFAWRRECQKCQKNRQGVKAAQQQVPGTASGLNLDRREVSRRHPKLMILSINLMIGRKTGQKPRLEDHILIMKQAGLKLSEVRGKVAKIGYLEVALEPGATCAADAIREGSKYVDT